MFVKKCFSHSYCLLAVVALVLLSGFSFPSIAKGVPVTLPDSVQIEIDTALSSSNNKLETIQVVTLTDPISLQKLYQSVYALPQMPSNTTCTTEIGPHYTLAFQKNDKTLAIAIAKREGCHPVTITGEPHARQAGVEFWTLLDQAIQTAQTSQSFQSIYQDNTSSS